MNREAGSDENQRRAVKELGLLYLDNCGLRLGERGLTGPCLHREIDLLRAWRKL